MPVGVVLSRWPDAARAAQELHDEVSGRDGVWRLSRGALAYLAIPMLALAAVAAAGLTYRRRPRSAVLFVTYTVTANLLVQGVKHPLLWQPAPLEELNPLSGHVGVAAGVAFGWLLVAPARLRPVSAAAAVVVVTVVSVGVLLAGWHRLPQVLTPLLICTGCAVAAAAWQRGTAVAKTDQRLLGAGLVVALAAVGAGAVLVSRASSLPSLVTITGWVVLGVVVGAVASICAIVDGPGAGRAPGRPEPSRGVTPAT